MYIGTHRYDNLCVIMYIYHLINMLCQRQIREGNPNLFLSFNAIY
jgi:hypothetical protein